MTIDRERIPCHELLEGFHGQLDTKLHVMKNIKGKTSWIFERHKDEFTTKTIRQRKGILWTINQRRGNYYHNGSYKTYRSCFFRLTFMSNKVYLIILIIAWWTSLKIRQLWKVSLFCSVTAKRHVSEIIVVMTILWSLPYLWWNIFISVYAFRYIHLYTADDMQHFSKISWWIKLMNEDASVPLIPHVRLQPCGP